LCPACDHRIRGFPYCQDCIVAGVELLTARPAFLQAPRDVRRKTSPWIALLLSFVLPGLGAAYNGQISKALVQFALFAGCLQMSAATDAVAFFVLASIGVWLYAAVDSYRTAELIRAGLAPDSESDPIARRLYGRPVAWAVVLIGLGTLFLLHSVFGFQLPVQRVLPAVLVVLGAYTLFDYLRGARRPRDYAFDGESSHSAAASGALDVTRFRSGDLAAHSAQARRRDETWPPRA
jgi:hypothetical protein